MAILNSIKNFAKIGVLNTKIGTKMAVNGVKNAPKMAVNGVKNAPKMAVNGVKSAPKMAVNGVKNAPNNIIKSTFIDTENKKKTLGNLYTGKRINPKHFAVVGGGYLAFNQAKMSLEYQMEPLKRATMNNYQYIGPPEIMMYDGVGQERVPKNLNVDGSIVFDLHNNRRG